MPAFMLRPVSPSYNAVSTAMLSHVRRALAGLASVTEAVDALAANLKQCTSDKRVMEGILLALVFKVCRCLLIVKACHHYRVNSYQGNSVN